jgi:predicted enzyme related to lactoylglutathione lyase
VQVGDVEEARRFYGSLFGGSPDFEPHEDFLEWRVGAEAETWFQVVGVAGEVRPLLNRVRFRVTDLGAARAAVLASGTDVSAVTTLPGVVRWFDFADPWGNQLGYFEDLVPAGTQPGPGGSVHDPGQFLLD